MALYEGGSIHGSLQPQRPRGATRSREIAHRAQLPVQGSGYPALPLDRKSKKPEQLSVRACAF